VLLFGAVLASAVFPIFEGFVGRLGGRRKLAAVVFAGAFVTGIVTPITIATISVAGDVAASAQGLGQKVREDGVDGLLQRLPGPVRSGLDQAGIDGAALQDRVAAASGRVVAASGVILRGVGLIVVSLIMLVIALAVFLIEGHALRGWIVETLPLERRQTSELVDEFHKLSTSVVLGNFGTALCQAIVACIGFLIAGAPSPLVFTLFTFVFSMVPTVGGSVVGLVAAAVVALLGEHGWQPLFLCAWALFAVGTVDNVVKPLLVKRGVEMNGALIFFAILSGIAAFGAVGLLLGPFIVGFALALLRIYRRFFRGPLYPVVTVTTTAAAAPTTTTQLTPAPAR
jgi:predicted PurR-regulated permease PerM